NANGIDADDDGTVELPAPPQVAIKRLTPVYVAVVSDDDEDDGDPELNNDGLAALSGATVYARPTGGDDEAPSYPAVPSGFAGSYVITGLPTGTYELVASAPLHGTVTSASFSVANGDTAVQKRLGLPQFPTMSIDVIADTDLDGSVDGDVTTATITATPVGGGPVVTFSRLVDEYVAAMVPVDTYTLSISAPGYVSQTGVSSGALALGQRTPITPSVTLLRHPPLTVTVADGDGVGNVAGATVVATPTNAGAPVTLTDGDADGIYTADRVTPGTYTITASRDGWTSASVSRTVTAGSTANTTATLTIEQLGSIALVIFDEEIDTGNELADVTAELWNEDGELLDTKITGDDGVVTFGDLAAGDYTVELSKDRFESDDVPVDLDPIMDFSDQIVLLAWPTLSIDLKGTPSGAPVEDASVTASREGGDTITLLETGVPGTYSATSVEPGIYTVTASASRHETTVGEHALIDVDAGADNTGVDVGIDEHPSLTVTVEADTDWGIAPLLDAVTGATVTATPVGGGLAIDLQPTATAGQYSAAYVPPGSYTVSATKLGYTSDASSTDSFTATAGVAIASVVGADTDLALQLLRNPTIALQLYTDHDFNDDHDLGADDLGNLQAITDATVTATPTSGGGAALVFDFVSTGGGTYLLENVAPDVAYDIAIAAPGHEPDTIGAVSAAAGEFEDLDPLELTRHSDITARVIGGAGGTARSGATVVATPTDG
ncbi:MAG TPA: carboxypeptidase regulatory-like domain-containing protein, partial [Acidimicrobiales bacterium]|nr:carboxypeptidase regulatory-like domain-containing protein [Acidimicrobiales bacterium]